ncbi:class I glutamine amidotransferase-like protein [Halenospora varia]|nr:class I glutamine amidotransferase-like protein [Halenospora varia]
MSSTLQVIILDANEPNYPWEKNKFSPLFKEFIGSLSQQGVPPVTPVISSYDVVQEEYPRSLSGVNVVVITGSSASVNDGHKHWIYKLQLFIKTVWYFEPQIKLFGSCFGHQILCKTILELDVKRIGWEIGVQPIILSSDFVDEFSTATSSKPPNPIRIQLVHQDHVIPPPNRILPPNCIILGRSAQCQIQGVYWPRRLLTFQGHPEFDRHICRETTEAFLVEDLKMDSGLRKKSLQAIDQDDDSWWTRQAIWSFFLQPPIIRC